MRPRRTIRHGLVIAIAFAAVAGAQQSNEQRVDSLFAEQTRGESPGAAVIVVREGRVLFKKGYGYADLEHRVPITPTTVFDVASVSKQFTGLAVAMLIEQGRVKTTDDIRKYIPQVDLGRTVTVDHLLHHTSGVRDWPGMLSLAGWRFDDVISFDQILRFAFAQRTLNFDPGSEYMYSNTGYNLLAEMVKGVTGQSFRAWTDENLFRPLDMRDSHFQDDHTRPISNRALGYSRRRDGTYANVTDNLTALGSSSLFSTVEDLAKWVTNFDDAKVGGAPAMAMTRTRGVLTNGTTIPYAFGISHGEYRGLAQVNHSGGWAGFATFVLHFPAKKFGVVVLSNGGGVNPSRASFDLADIFLDTELGPRQAVAQMGSTGPVASVTPGVLDRYVGLYRLGPGWYVRIRRDGDVLKAQASREAEFAMTPRSETEFWVAGYNAPMVFAAVAGQPVRMQYRGRIVDRLEESPGPTPAQLAACAGEYESTELGTRYRVEVKDGKLVMQHWRHGAISLTWLWRDDFTGSASFTRSVEFQRDETAKVAGFAVHVDDRSRNVRFVKRS